MIYSLIYLLYVLCILPPLIIEQDTYLGYLIMANDIHHLPFNRVDSVDVTDPRENNTFLDINELNRINDKNDVNDRFDHTLFSKYILI